MTEAADGSLTMEEKKVRQREAVEQADDQALESEQLEQVAGGDHIKTGPGGNPYAGPFPHL